MQYLAAYTLATLSGKEPSTSYLIQLRNLSPLSYLPLENQLMLPRLVQWLKNLKESKSTT